jgi:hypothetical protein
MSRCSEYQDGGGERWSSLRASQLHGTQAGATGHVILVLQVSVVHRDAGATGQCTRCWCYRSRNSGAASQCSV